MASTVSDGPNHFPFATTPPPCLFLCVRRLIPCGLSQLLTSAWVWPMIDSMIDVRTVTVFWPIVLEIKLSSQLQLPTGGPSTTSASLQGTSNTESSLWRLSNCFPWPYSLGALCLSLCFLLNISSLDYG